MTPEIWFVFGFVWKAGVTATAVILVTLTAERVGTTFAAILMGLPLSIGPALALLAISHGDAFLADGANHAVAISPKVFFFFRAPCPSGWPVALTGVRVGWPVHAACLCRES